jgi:hypothetical protein
MSQIALTNLERIQALQPLGYHEREAHFLCLAALHGGYFLRRQYADFIVSRDGGSVTQLIEKTLGQGHAEAATYKANVHVYHLAARPFYAALGQEDNRNRRRKELVTIKAKLMGLDFVLAHPKEEYLATEQEKCEFFCTTMSLNRELLPTKRYASRGQVTDRYFVEKYPVFHSPSAQPAGSPVVSFCFVDPGMASVCGFETFLDQYARLFAALREFTVIYVAANDALFGKAGATFEHWARRGRHVNAANSDTRNQRILEYFETRRLYETRHLASFDRARLIRLRDEKQEFSGPDVEALYERWKAAGEVTVPEDLGPTEARHDSVSGKFSTYLLEHSYDLFGNLTTY